MVSKASIRLSDQTIQKETAKIIREHAGILTIDDSSYPIFYLEGKGVKLVEETVGFFHKRTVKKQVPFSIIMIRVLPAYSSETCLVESHNADYDRQALEIAEALTPYYDNITIEVCSPTYANTQGTIVIKEVCAYCNQQTMQNGKCTHCGGERSQPLLKP